MRLLVCSTLLFIFLFFRTTLSCNPCCFPTSTCKPTPEQSCNPCCFPTSTCKPTTQPPPPASPTPPAPPRPQPLSENTSTINSNNMSTSIGINNTIKNENNISVPISISNRNQQSINIAIVPDANPPIPPPTTTPSFPTTTPHSDPSITTPTISSSTTPRSDPNCTTPTVITKIVRVPVPIPVPGPTVFVPIHMPYPIVIPWYPPPIGCCYVLEPCILPYDHCPGFTRSCSHHCTGNYMYTPINPCDGGCYRREYGAQWSCTRFGNCQQSIHSCLGCQDNFYETYDSYARCRDCFVPNNPFPFG